MCTGAEAALVAGGLAQAGGSYLNTQNANKNAQAKINAKNNAAAQETQRQKQFQLNNDAALNTSLNQFDKETRDTNFGDLVASREQAYAANAPAEQEFAAISADAPQVVKEDKAKRVATELAKSKAQAKALAKIGGTADLFQNNGLSINSAANKIGTTNNLARGSLDVNRIEQVAAANNAGNKSSMFGDLLSAAGAGAGLYGAANGGFASLLGSAGNVAKAARTVSPAGVPYDNATYAAAPITAIW